MKWLQSLPLRWIFEVFYLSSRDPWQYWRSEFENQRYDAAVSLIGAHAKEAAILEVGCSVGAFTRRLLALSPARLVAIDISSVALRRVRRKLAAPNLQTANLDVFTQAPPFPPYDLIVAMDVLGYTDDLAVLRATRDRLLEVLRPQGRLLLGNTRLKAHDGEGFEPFASGFPRLGATAILECFAERARSVKHVQEARWQLDLLEPEIA